MRKLIVSAFVSMDGVMQAPGGPEEDSSGGFTYGGWTVPLFDEEVGEAIGAWFANPFELLLGRRTYDIFAAHWPRAEDGPDAELARLFNSTAKYVATTSTSRLQWQNSVAIHDVAGDVAKLKKSNGPDLLVQGSSHLIQTLLKHHLVDQFNLIVFPVVLGMGKRLFADATPATALRLVSSRVTRSGVAANSYVPAGPVLTGSFAL